MLRFINRGGESNQACTDTTIPRDLQRYLRHYAGESLDDPKQNRNIKFYSNQLRSAPEGKNSFFCKLNTAKYFFNVHSEMKSVFRSVDRRDSSRLGKRLRTSRISSRLHSVALPNPWGRNEYPCTNLAKTWGSFYANESGHSKAHFSKLQVDSRLLRSSAGWHSKW